MGLYAQVIISFATVPEIDKYFTYSVPEVLQSSVKVGCRVHVPFGKGNKTQLAYVMTLLDTAPTSNYRIKSIVSVVAEETILSTEQLALASFLVSHYGCTYAAAIDLILPAGLTSAPLVRQREQTVFLQLNQPVASVEAYSVENVHKKTFEKQAWLLKQLGNGHRHKLEDLQKELSFGKSSMQTLIKNNWIKKVACENTFVPDVVNEGAFKRQTAEQRIASEKIEQALNGEGGTFLLKGITGSGKTEVFLYAIKKVLERGGSAIVLVPEIALTMQTLNRFKERFGNNVALTHSRMTPQERQRLYLRVRDGEVRVVIGPRSAVFMPMRGLGLIVVDEEHETTYKSETTPKYHAIEVAKMRSAYNKGVALLASATPSLESYYQVAKGEIGCLELTQRATGATLPDIEIVDLRQELREGNMQVISRRLHEAIQQTLQRGEQVMLLLNRRGHSTFISCRSCGFVVKCKHCDLTMTYHKQKSHLACHYCGAQEPVPTTCPSCGSEHIRFFGNGTQKVEEYLNRYFENYGVGRMDFDTTTGKEGHSKILEAFRTRQFNILIGTQMIAKGHDFPNVTLVGIIAADMSLYVQDFRSEEKTFQLITQALGRAGRADKKGHVIIQTYNPEHQVLESIKHSEQEAFYQSMLYERKSMGYPPYTHIFQVLVTGKNEQDVIRSAHMLGNYYQYYNKKGFFRILGPVVASIGRIEDTYRWKLMMIGEDREKLLMYGKYCLNKFNLRENTDTIKIVWDIDPLTIL